MEAKANDSIAATLSGLELPDPASWPRRYREAIQSLPFPLGRLLLGAYRQRHVSPAAFVSCLTWFFEVAYRFLLCLVLRPLIIRGRIDSRLAQFLGRLLGLSDAGDKPLTLGAWKDLAFECISRVLEDAATRTQVPAFLREYHDFPQRLARLRDLYSAFVHFRNRVEHGVRDGNIATFHQTEADLYERALIQFLMDFEALGECGLLVIERTGKGDPLAVEVTSQGDLVPRSEVALPPATTYAEAEPSEGEAFLVRWNPHHERALEAWSLHPFVKCSLQSDGRLTAWLFRRYDQTRQPVVIFDSATAGAAGQPSYAGHRDTDPAIVSLLQRLRKTAERRIAKSVNPADAELTALQGRLVEEKERERRELVVARQQEAERRRRLHLDRIPYPRDPLFRGRQQDIKLIVDTLKQRRSLQVQSYLYGMGGVGKTALAVEICHRLVDEQVFSDGVLWYRVRADELPAVVLECAAALQLGPELGQQGGPTLVETFQAALRKLDLLIVLDNADYPVEQLRPLFDLFARLPLLITSRNELDLPGALTLRLSGLDPADAVTLMKAVLGHRSQGDPDAWQRYGTDRELEELARTLGFLPLALRLATFHMLQERVTVREYLERWRSQRDRFGLLQAHLVEKDVRLRDVKACISLSFNVLDAQAQRVLMHLGHWESRELSLEHLRRTLSETIHPQVSGHDGAVTAVTRVPESSAVLTGGKDGRVLLWSREAENPRPLTVLRMEAPVVTILPPCKDSVLAAGDSGNAVAIVAVDIPQRRIGSARWFAGTAGPPRLVRLADGRAAHVATGEDGELLVPLEGHDKALRRSEGVDTGSSPAAVDADLLSWLQLAGQQWEAPASPRDTDLKGPPVTSSVTKVARSVKRRLQTLPSAPRLQRTSEADGLKELIVRQLVGASLVEDNLSTTGELRVRLHPLVSEFSLQLLGAESRSETQRTVQSFYFAEFGQDTNLLDTDEPNVAAACAWYLRNTEPRELIAGTIGNVCDKLVQRARWPLALEIYRGRLAAALDAGDSDAAATLLARVANHLERMGRYEEARPLQRRAVRELVASAEREPLNKILPGLLFDCLFEEPTGRDRDELERWLRRVRGRPLEVLALANNLRSAVHGSIAAAISLRLAETTSDEDLIAGYRHSASEWSSLDQTLQAGQAVVDLAVKKRREWSLAFALSGHIETLISTGDLAGARSCLRDYRSLSELRDKQDALALADLYEALLCLREGRVADAVPFRERAVKLSPATAPGVAPHRWFDHASMAVIAGDWNRVTVWLAEGHAGWKSLDAMDRWAYHAIAACMLLAQSRVDLARRAWAHAEAYRTLGLRPSLPIERPELFAPAKIVQLTAEARDDAMRAVWGNSGLPRIPLDPELRGNPLRLLLPAYLRRHALTVDEMWAFFGEHPSRPVPWYYREHCPEARGAEPARFLSYSLAAEILEWLGEEPPRAANWCGLRIPSSSLPDSPEGTAPTEVDIETWARSQADYQNLCAAILDRLSDDVRALASAVLLSDVLTAIDKWRLLGRLGLRRRPERNDLGRRLASSLPVRAVPEDLAKGVQQRLLFDWRSLAFLEGLAEAPAEFGWLRPEFVLAPSTFEALPGVGVVGPLRPSPQPSGMLLVPNRCAWADVVSWPSKLLDPSPYHEEPPPWP